MRCPSLPDMANTKNKDPRCLWRLCPTIKAVMVHSNIGNIQHNLQAKLVFYVLDELLGIPILSNHVIQISLPHKYNQGCEPS